MYERGDGVPADRAEASRYYFRAADIALAKVAGALMRSPPQSDELPWDPDAVVYAFDQGAERGHAKAQYAVGALYAGGCESMGVPQEYTEAVRWYRKAAEQGLASAQFDLGLMYASGHGVPQDYVLAHMWFNLSASSNRGDQSLQAAAATNERRIQARDEVARKMTPDQIAEAQRRAREWKPKP